MSKKNKKLLILLIIIVGLYIISTTYGLNREDSAMGKAMAEVRGVVAETRAEIKKEMDKPFILRLFGSLFGMEGNSFQGMKDKLPKIMEKAMPKSIVNVSASSPNDDVACVGMRLGDALLYLKSKNLEIGSLSWTFDDKVSDNYIQLSGSILAAQKDKNGKAVMVLQMNHAYNGEGGLGASAKQRSDAEAMLSTSASLRNKRFLGDWFTNMQQGDAENKLLAAGIPLVSLKTLPVSWTATVKLP